MINTIYFIAISLLLCGCSLNPYRQVHYQPLQITQEAQMNALAQCPREKDIAENINENNNFLLSFFGKSKQTQKQILQNYKKLFIAYRDAYRVCRSRFSEAVSIGFIDGTKD